MTTENKSDDAEASDVRTGSSIWQSAATAPKTRVILADIGYPWPLACLWDAEVEAWAFASLNVEAHNAANESANVWWETETEHEIIGWMEMPSLPNAEGETRRPSAPHSP